MGDIKSRVQGFHSSYPSRTNTNPVEAALLLCCFIEDYNIMAWGICINRCWLVGGKAIILIGFLFYTCIAVVKPWPWMPINTQTKHCTASIRSAWDAPISPNTLLESWTEILLLTTHTALWPVDFIHIFLSLFVVFSLFSNEDNLRCHVIYVYMKIQKDFKGLSWLIMCGDDACVQNNTIQGHLSLLQLFLKLLPLVK